MKKYKKFLEPILTCIIILLLCWRIISQKYEIDYQKTEIIKLELENEQLKNNEDIELECCPLCGGNVVMQPVNDSFYIECEECELHTDFFNSKNDLINYWNNRNHRNQANDLIIDKG